MRNRGLTALRAVLVLAGAFIVFTGINVGFGGMTSLGWQGERAFLKVTNEHPFLAQDSHIRFLGGLWLGIGIIFIVAASNLRKYRLVLTAAFGLIFIGGLTRLTQLHPEIVFGPDILGSFVAEIIGMPILYVWLSKVTREGNVPPRLTRSSMMAIATDKQ
ncbi:MAG: DUF4345 domain-containing protein [Acidobacteriota bacterium]